MIKARVKVNYTKLKIMTFSLIFFNNSVVERLILSTLLTKALNHFINNMYNFSKRKRNASIPSNKHLFIFNKSRCPSFNNNNKYIYNNRNSNYNYIRK